MSDDDDFVSCPNCQCLCPQADLQPISIGSIYRHAKVLERAQHALVRSGQTQATDGQLIPLHTLFSDQKVNWVPMPPILELLNYDMQEIGQHPILQRKDTHVCSQCYSVYADDIEVKHRLTVVADRNAKRAKSAARSQSASSRNHIANRPQESIVFERHSDRRKDFAFTALQSNIRNREMHIDEKRRARRKLVELQSSDIDWEGLPVAAEKEVRRIQQEATSTELAIIDSPNASSRHPNDLALVPAMPHRAMSATGSRHEVSASWRGGGALPEISEPLSSKELDQIMTLAGGTGADKDSKTPFDVPLQHRFMHELWSRMCTELDFGAEDAYLHLTDVKGDHVKNQHLQLQLSRIGDSSVRPSEDPATESTILTPRSQIFGKGKPDAVPIRHPFFPLYCKNQLRLPSPPVPVMVQKPSVVSTAANVEDAILRVDHLILKNAKALKDNTLKGTFGAGGLSIAEQEMLAMIVGDPTIEVTDDEDDIRLAESEDEEFIEEDEEGADVFDDY